MLRVYRGWMFTPDSTEDKAVAKKELVLTLRGSYHEIVNQIDRYERKRSEEEIAND